MERSGTEDTAGGRERVAGIDISSGARLVFPDAGLTKLDLAHYFEAVAERMLKVAADRPLSLVRMPEGWKGERFFQKHAGRGWPEALRRVPIKEASGKTADYIYVTDAAGLVGAVQMGAIEFHIWGARRDRLDRPDRLVFDLDPGEGVDFPDIRAAARDLGDMLSDLGLPSRPLVTGGKGVHVVVLLRRIADWDRVKLFSQSFATLLARQEPDRFTADMSKARREGRIFIDYLRNERGSTAIAPFSVRARPGAPVAMPVGWDELERLKGAASFSTAAALDRGWERTPPARLGSLTGGVMAALERLFS